MSREIKFRAWDGQSMIYESVQDEYDDYYMLNLQGEFFPHTRTGDEYFNYESDPENKIKFILMQYTGLKDKNNKEIYEGDICEADYVGSNAGKYRNQIIWDENECGFLFAGSPMWTWENIELIGNIYQNPELISK